MSSTLRRPVRSLALLASVALGLYVVTVATPFAFAQVATADLLGTVADASGGAVPGATILVTNLDTGAQRTVKTDDGGNYLVSLLPPARYGIKVERDGFKSYTVTDMGLAPGDRRRLDISLQVGTINQSVEVVGQATALQTDSATVGSLIGSKAVADLPLNGRNFISLVQYAAGATDNVSYSWSTGGTPDDTRRPSSVAVNGQYGSDNDFLIDGMDNNERFIGSIIVKPAVEGLAEIQVSTNSYSAELGRTAGGAVNMITKNGTNEFHGSAYEYFRNQVMDARNFFTAATQPKPAYRQNEPGGSLGGPIKKNRTFFFVDFESFRYSQGAPAFESVPTALEKAGNFSQTGKQIYDPLNNWAPFANDIIPASRVNPVGQNVANLYPTTNLPGIANNFYTDPTKYQTDDDADLRIDHKISDKDSFYGRYSVNQVQTLNAAPFPTTGNGINPSVIFNANQRSQGIQLNDVHLFSPTVVAEYKLGFSRMSIFSLPEGYGQNWATTVGIPNVNVDSESYGLPTLSFTSYNNIGHFGYTPEITINNVYQGSASVMLTKGAQNIKIGVELRRRLVPEHQSPSGAGSMGFTNAYTSSNGQSSGTGGDAIASDLLGYWQTESRSKYLIYPGYRTTELGMFIQDDWHVAHWLTLNIGLREDVFTPITEQFNRISNINLATGQVVVAGQNGVSNTAGVQTDWMNLAPRFGFSAQLDKRTVIRGGYGTSFFPPFLGSPMAFRNPPFSNLVAITNANGVLGGTIDQGFPYPTPAPTVNPPGNLMAVAYNLQMQYVMQYNVTAQRELPGDIVVSVGYVGALGRKMINQNNGPDVNMPYPGPGALVNRRPYGTVFPNASEIYLYNSWGNTEYQALQATIEHRFHSGFGLSANYTYAHSLDNFYYLMFPTGAQQFWENAAGDIPQRFVLTGNYQLPWGNHAKGLVGALVKGWQLNAVVLMENGAPFNVTDNTAQSNTGQTDQPNLIANPTLPASQRTLLRYFNTAAFQVQPVNTWGNAAKNILHAPGKQDLDFSVHKEFHPFERMSFQFRAEAFNTTNTTQFNAPNGAVGNPLFGEITSAGAARNVQLGVKVLF